MTNADDALRRLARDRRPAVQTTVYGSGRNRPERSIDFWIVVMSVLTIAVLVVMYPLATDKNVIAVDGLVNQSTITSAALRDSKIRFRIKPVSELDKAIIRINGTPGQVIKEETTLRWVPPELPEGEHVLTITSGRRHLWRGPTTKRIVFRVDSKAPELTIDPVSPSATDGVFIVSGSVDEDVQLTVGGIPTRLENRRFSVRFRSPPIGSVHVVAKDRAGTIDEEYIRTGVTLPDIRGVYVTAAAWNDQGRRAALVRLIDEGRINAVVLDLKDESGFVSYRTKNAEARALGAAADRFDLAAAVQELHSRGVRVMGRIVAFRDPLVARKALSDGSSELLVQDLAGNVLRTADGPFVNVASKKAQDYIASLAREAAELGVDDVLLASVARPNGQLSSMRFSGLSLDAPALDSVDQSGVATASTTTTVPAGQGAPVVVRSPEERFDDAVAGFLERVGQRLRGTRARLGAVVSIYAVRRQSETGENVKRMAKVVDYVVPMILPSELKPGGFNVSEPAAYPADVVLRSLGGFVRSVKQSDSDAVVVPFLQDFSLGRNFGPRQVSAQIKAAREVGATRFLLWDPKVSYSREGIPVVPELAMKARNARTAGRIAVAPTVAQKVSTSTAAGTNGSNESSSS